MWSSLLLVASAHGFLAPGALPARVRPVGSAAAPRCAGAFCVEDPDPSVVFPPPTVEQSGVLGGMKPSPALQPREVITSMLHALHRRNFDSPTARFGCEVALRFIAPSNPASRATPQRFADYLSQSWYQPLLGWSEYRFEGDLVLLGEGEAYQHVSVRSSPGAPWVSVRWILVRVPFYATSDQWMVEQVFVEEPDGDESPARADISGGAHPDGAKAAAESPADVVLTVMRAVRAIDEPYPLAGAEVAIRYCSPSNRASRQSPQGFAQYLREPWYRILLEWDEIQLDEPPEVQDAAGSVVYQECLVRREGDDSWTVVNWELSKHSGRWLTDAITITE